MKTKELKRNKGITLIALVITIIVLLILAGVTIATLMGDNGILTRASEAQNEQADATVKDAISLAWNEYQIIINESTGEVIENETKIASITQVKIRGQEENYLASPTMSFWDFLKDEKGYIDENGVIDVETLTGEKLSKGNGTDGVTDVYKIEQVDETYTLKYCGENNEETTLWEASNGSGTYPEAASKDVFGTTETEDGIIITDIKRVGNDTEQNMYTVQGGIVDLVIPRTINGKPVVAIEGGFSWCYYLKSVIIPDTVEIINDDVFDYSNGVMNLTQIVFPNGVNENLTIPENKWGARNAQIIGKDGEILKE